MEVEGRHVPIRPTPVYATGQAHIWNVAVRENASSVVLYLKLQVCAYVCESDVDITPCLHSSYTYGTAGDAC